jgi:hypothetical protein
MTATNVSQFSVDCQDLSVATSAVPSVVPTGAPNPKQTTSTATFVSDSSDTGLSGGAKAGIAIGAAVLGLGLVGVLVFFVIRNNRKKRQDMEARRVQEADSQPPAGHYTEMPLHNEKRGALEMYAAVPQEIASSEMEPVEAPSDGRWGPRQELPGDYAPSEKEGSAVPAKTPGENVDAQDLLSDGTTVVESDPKRNSNTAEGFHHH